MKRKLHFVFCLLCIAFMAITLNAQSIIPVGAKPYKGKKIKNSSYEIEPVLLAVDYPGNVYEVFKILLKFNGPPTHIFDEQGYYYSFGNIRFEMKDFVVTDIYAEAGIGNTNGSIGNIYSYNYSLFLPYYDATDGFFELASVQGYTTSVCTNLHINTIGEFPPTRVFNNNGELSGTVYQFPPLDPNCVNLELKVSQTTNNIFQIEGQPYSNEVINLSVYDLMGKRLFAKSIEPQNQYFLESVELEHLRKNNLYILHFANNEINETIKYLPQ